MGTDSLCGPSQNMRLRLAALTAASTAACSASLLSQVRAQGRVRAVDTSIDRRNPPVTPLPAASNGCESDVSLASISLKELEEGMGDIALQGMRVSVQYSVYLL